MVAPRAPHFEMCLKFCRRVLVSIGWYLLLVIAHTLFILCSCSALVSNVTRWRWLLLFLPSADTGYGHIGHGYEDTYHII